MAKNFVAVCVVCLLCADHLPCKSHIPVLGQPDGIIFGADQQYSQKAIDNVMSSSAVSGGNHLYTNQEQLATSHTRRKRHDVNLHADADDVKLSQRSRAYLEKMFDRYGDRDTKTMDLAAFHALLQHLGLTNLLSSTAEGQPHNESACLSSRTFIEAISSDAHRHSEPHSGGPVAKREVGGSGRREIAASTNELLDSATKVPVSGSTTTTIANDSSVITATPSNGVVNEAKAAPKVDTNALGNICPVLLYHLVLADKDKNSCIATEEFLHADDDHDHHGPDAPRSQDRVMVWVYASASVLGVSLCGMLGFAVIPCMDKSFYNTMLQFLVALAVGTLAGDALLHLMPHAMILSIETAAPGAAHTSMTLKGLVAVLGVIAFFAIERGLTMIAEWRKERQKKQQLPGRVRVMRDPESVSLNNSEKQCKNKYSSYPYCYDEIAMDTKDDHHHHHHSHASHGHSHAHGHSHGHDKRAAAATGGMSTTSLGTGAPFKQNTVLPMATKSDEPPMSFDHSQLHHHHDGGIAIPAITNGTHKSSSKMESLSSTGSNNNNLTADNSTLSSTLDDGVSIESSRMLKPTPKTEENYTVILREHESKHHGHSHTHGHVHSPPGSLSAVAWMVVMGDGLHNFTDGMAIGAAFSNDIAGGFSTAIAVFCHELPHELGDFAVLLKAGMSAKKAVYYNLLSSILSFLGMALGICIGDTPEASAWIFAIAAGLFIYIALVDMVPELTSSHREDCAGSHTLLQVLGMCAGLSIMLLIALNEEDLKSLFTEGKGGHHHH